MGKLIDLSNQRFGFWFVLRQGSKSKSGQTQWICQCECGVQKEITSNSLRSGNSTSCGCNKIHDLAGETFGNLKVIKPDYSKGRKYWLCRCICNNEIVCPSYKLHNHQTISCGCKNYKYSFTDITGKSTSPFNEINDLKSIPEIEIYINKEYFFRLSLINDINVSNLSMNTIHKLIAEFHNGYTYEHIGNISINKNNNSSSWLNFKKSINHFKELELPIFEDKWKTITHQNITPLAKILKSWGGIDTNPDVMQPLILRLQHQNMKS